MNEYGVNEIMAREQAEIAVEELNQKGVHIDPEVRLKLSLIHANLAVAEQQRIANSQLEDYFEALTELVKDR